ncbi:MAG TPA: hypothetical protein VKF35_25435 [Hyphomicrobiaceae bacterium]|jgi:hypothetical protein|nr:hypothetical protein [Hyphomicrobiaceae bacterium]
MELWNGLKDDVREMLWLASLIGALSMLGVGLAVILAIAADNWQTWSAVSHGVISPV